MKRISRIWVLALSALMLFYLFGCSEKIESSPWERILYTKLGENAHAFSNEGYYYMNNDGFLCFLDLKNGGNVILCSKTACLHNKEPDVFKRRECEAMIGAKNMFFWDNGLYYLDLDMYGYQLYRRAADGTAEEHIMTLGENYIGKDTSISILSLALAEGILYYQADISEENNIGQNETIGEWSYNVICRVDLRSRKETEIVHEEDNTLNMCAARNDAVLYTSCENIDSTDPNYAEKLKSVKVRLEQWNLQTGNSDILWEAAREELYQFVGFFNGMLFYTDMDAALWSYELETGKIAAAGPEHTVKVLNDRYLISYREPRIRDIYDIQKGTFIENAFSDTSLDVQDMGKLGFIMKRTNRDANDKNINAIYSFVAFDSLADGLQKTDVLDFYTNWFGQ